MNRPAIVVYVAGEEPEVWREQLQAHLPGHDIRLLGRHGAPEEVRFAAVWAPPAGALGQFPRLRCVVSLAAGADNILADPDLPAHVTVLRLVGEPLRARMREYVVLHVLALHRGSMNLLRAQAAQQWGADTPDAAGSRRVGVLGLGELGADCARALAALGFRVAGWSRSLRQIPDVECFHGFESLDQFLARTEILVNLLPLTPETLDLLDASRLARLPVGATLVNAGRGEHVVEGALLDALNSGRLSGAVLDTFREEPLDPGHPFWRHPRIWVTPHVAAPLLPEDGARLAAEQIRYFEEGGPVARVQRDRGY